jgi:DNA mismatch repair protein MutL
MGKINRLAPELANQIAAGEVVERPASVVKELIENALDAGASRIVVSTEAGGKKLVRVEDDGEGMDREDAKLALERHATSKIGSAEDLAAIMTLGFRGEALPAIASVSHVVLRTKLRETSSGTEIRLDGGELGAARDVGMAVGTIVEVGDLFFNLPARRKFLKSDAAESAQVSKVVTQMALAYPEVGFTLVSGARTVLQCPPVRTLPERFYQIHGERPDLVEVNGESSGLRVSGYAAALAEQGPTRGPQHVFVNRRVVRDRTVAHAVIEAYSVASIKERSPEVYLFIEMPPDQVDVNVHPTKAEVRFRDQSFVHQLVRRAVGAALGEGPAPELRLRSPVAAVPQPAAVPIPGLLGRGVFGRPWSSSTSAPPSAGSSQLASRQASPPGGPAGGGDVGSPGGIEAEASETRVRPMMPLGQFRDTFIVAIDEEGIAIVDQHVAHERVLFERFLEALTAGRLESQRLLEPMILQVPPAGRQALVAHADDLERFGFEIAEFGGDSVRVSSVPAMLSPSESAAAVRALADDLDQLDQGSRMQEALRRIAATTACHAAVKANDPLTFEKMVHILEELRRTAYSTVCPHGRPVMLRLTRREIERNFQRI